MTGTAGTRLGWTMRVAAAATAAMLGAMPAQAQVFIDVFAGRSFPQSAETTIRADEARIDGEVVPADLRVTIDSLSPSDSTIFGARIGHWWGAFGIAVDAATLDPDVDAQTVRATATLGIDEELFGERIVIDPGASVAVDIPRVSIPTTATVAALAMVRLPGGAIEPYAFAGPVYLVTDTDLSGDWGIRAGGGGRIALGRNIGLFAEYRYTNVDATAAAGSFSATVEGIRGTTGTIFVDARVRNHSAIGGISFRF